MFAPVPHHRLATFAILITFALPASAFAYDASRCLDQAVRDRTEDLEDAYDDYNEVLERQLDRFDSVERNAYKELDDLRYRYGEVYRGQYSYSQQIQEANRNLQSRVQQIWNDYASRIALCSGQDYYSPDYHYNQSTYNTPYNYYDMYGDRTRTTRKTYYRYPTNYRTYLTPPDSYNSGYYPTYNTTLTTYPYYGGHSNYNYPTGRVSRDWCRLPTFRSDPGCGYTCTVGGDGCFECSQYCY
jgi:hypothetical protein